MSIIRKNLMERPGYSPYCGSELCKERTPSSPGRWPRTKFTGEQFKCPKCGWESEFPENFITEYKNKWHE